MASGDWSERMDRLPFDWSEMMWQSSLIGQREWIGAPSLVRKNVSELSDWLRHILQRGQWTLTRPL